MAEDTGGAAKDRVVGLLGLAWASLGDLLAELADDAWDRPALPGWTVHDVVAHVVGGERMLSGEESPATPADARERPHVNNAIAAANEGWRDALAERSPAEMTAEFEAVTARRLAMLEAMTQEEFDAPSWTPVGPGTYGRFMEIRVFDTWMHEQDIRVATDLPGHQDGPVADQSLHEVVGALGFIIGKRGGAPDGSTVTIHLTGPLARDLHVAVDGRARVVPTLSGPPTATLTLPTPLFLRLAGGRTDPEAALAQIELGGDAVLARQLATHLAFTI
jgi:uncharacterized protein (TIGR03083 family)